MLDDFMLYALGAGIGVALAAGPVGCFVIWRRMAYFGDAVSHAAILGVALALMVGLPIVFGVLVVAITTAILVAGSRGSGLAMDTLLGVTAHAALALGLVAVSLIPGRGIDLEAFLFGDILSLAPSDLFIIWAGVILVLAIMHWRWNAMLMSTLNDDLASAEGLDPDRERLLLALILAVLVAVAIKVVGALLITALLIIPAATARTLAKTPERMMLFSIGIGIISVVVGLQLSLTFDTPAGPSIVTAAALIFALSQILSLARR